MKGKAFLVVLTLIMIISLTGLQVSCLAPGEAPTLELEIYDGPDYSESDGMCYYRVEAVAKGTPQPQITFEDEDNIEPISPNRVKVGISPGEFYTLSVTASNSAGSANFSITLKGECDELASGTELIEKDASADEKELTETEDKEEIRESDEESVEELPEPEEELETVRIETVEEESQTEGESETVLGIVDAEIVLEGTDEGEAVEKERGHRQVNTTIMADKSMSGLIAAGGTIRTGNSPILIGDTTVGSAMKGFLSFDISSLHGTRIIISNIEFKRIFHTNLPGSFASRIIVEAVDYGDFLDIDDFYTAGWTILDEIPITATSHWIMGVGPDFDATVPLRYELQKAVDERRDYFQIRLQLDAATNGNDVIDSKDIRDCNRDVWLLVTYWEYIE